MSARISARARCLPGNPQADTHLLAGGVEAEERERRGVGGVNIPPPSDPRPLMSAALLTCRNVWY